MPSQTTLATGLTILRPQQGEPRLFVPQNSITASMTAVPIGVGIYTYIVGTAAQVLANVATHSDLSVALAATTAGSVILVLSGYTFTGNISISSQLSIEGQGLGSYVNGNFTLASGASNCKIKGLRVTQFILNSGTSGNIISESWWTTEFTDAGTFNLVTGVTL